MAKPTNKPNELTGEMIAALNELGKEVDKDHICDQCLGKMKSQVGFIGGLKLVLYECPACEYTAIKEMIG
jgi:hypothetical protein